jgi:hypothetical protein
MAAKKKLRPVLDGSYWLIGPNPDLSGRIDGDEEHRVAFERGKILEHNAPVDHHILQDIDGTWHLWGCVRATAVGRVLYHWETDDITKSPWRDTGEYIRADRDAGECIDDWNDEEWLQSPYFIREGDTFYMFYGGHRAGVDEHGNRQPPVPRKRDRPDPSLHQICLMTSENGRDWKRHKNPDGTSRVFMGPGETRDPCLIKIDGLWHMYYAGYYDWDNPEAGAGFVVRTSKDLIDWSDWKLVHQDGKAGQVRTDAECPHVVYRSGYYYLFRTVNYYRCLTLVYRSEDPYDFGIGDAGDKLVGRLPSGAPEIYEIDGAEYVSSSHSPLFGETMCRLEWVDDE